MTVEKIEKGTYYIVRINDIFDVSVFPEVRNAVNTALAVGHLYITFDLSNCTYMCSSAIGLIANVYKIFNELGGDATILSPSQNVHKLINQSKLDSYVDVMSSEAEMAAIV